MTDITHPDTIRYAIRRWEASKGTRSMSGAGDELCVILRQVIAKTEARGPEPVLPRETYTAAGLPRRAAARARENWAVITYLMDAIQVEFPNGSRIVQRTKPYSPLTANSPGRWGRLERFNGAAPGATPPKGGTIEEILNNYADEKEGRT